MIVLKDKKDIRHCPASFLKDHEWESHGQYDSLQFVNPDVKVLSVQFTKVGEKTYKAFPNLEWIIIRQHGFNNINIEECEQRGIGVVTTKPFAQSSWSKRLSIISFNTLSDTNSPLSIVVFNFAEKSFF